MKKMYKDIFILLILTSFYLTLGRSSSSNFVPSDGQLLAREQKPVLIGILFIFG